MTIEEIYNSGYISIRTFNICNQNALKDLNSILQYYHEFENFYKFKNCGRKSNEELMALCLKYFDYDSTHYTVNFEQNKQNISRITNFTRTQGDIVNSFSDINKNYLSNSKFDFQEIRNVETIEEIYNSGYISLRTFNICNENALKDLNSILQYYHEFENFYKFKNCGRKSNEELTALCLKYLDYESNQVEERLNSKVQLKYTINNLSRTQRDIVNSFIEITKKQLSNRSINSITLFLNGNFKIQNISEKILSNKFFDFQEIRNVGTKTVMELNSFLNSIIEFIKKVSEIKSENDLVALKNTLFIEKKLSISLTTNKIIKKQSIFNLIDFLINNDSIFEKNKKLIFQKSFKIYNELTETILEKKAEEINITKERERQIRKIILEKLFNYFEFIKNFQFNLFEKYNIDQNQNFIKIENDLNDLINSENYTNFSIEFNSFIIFTYISDKFDLVGDIEDVLLKRNFNSRGRHNWKCFYLVNNKFSSLFNFIDFANDIHNRLNQRIEDNYQFNFKSYLLNFSRSTNLDILNSISEAAEIILNIEFDIYIDTQDNIEFKRNSFKRTHEYAHEAIMSLGKPSKIKEIIEKIRDLHPDFQTDDSKIRASLNRNFGFVPIGRTSTFGLKEWESKMENFKGGTIRGIVYEYLESEVNPRHISEIALHVLKYRPKTYQRSILDNLRADETKTFIFFKNSIIGIKSKKYSNSYVELKQIETPEPKSWEERYNDFVQFTNINNRLPFSSGFSEEEIKLDRWHRAQKCRIKNGKLDSEKCNLLNQITNRLSRNDSNLKSRSNNLE